MTAMAAAAGAQWTRRTGTPRRWGRIAGGIVLLLVVSTLVGRTVSSDPGDQAMVKSSSTSDDAGIVRGDATAGGASGSATAKNVAGGDVGVALPASLGQDQVVKTAAVAVEVAKGGFAKAFSNVPTIAAAHGGFVASSNATRGDDGAPSSGSLVLRVPADRFDAARKDLIALGTLRSEELQGQDVGGQLTDLDARLRNLRSQEEAVRLLMTKAVNVGETIEIQRQLSTVREEIERLAGEQARLQDAVALSTLTLDLAEPGVAFEPTNRSPLASALAHAVKGTEDVLGGLIITVGYLLPLALLGALAWLVARPFAGRRRLDPVVATPAP
jgi:hypothetical protein